MADREKVIRGLECHGDGVYESCKPCPYHYDGCEIALCRDALALLKEQEPRVVTTADFENNPGLDDGGHLNVWEEYKSGARFGWNTINVNDVRAFTDIRRYWTSRPTPEQMRDTPWEGEKNAE
jgi:hypothetical protein